MSSLFRGLGYVTEIVNWRQVDFSADVSGILIQYPDTDGNVDDFSRLVHNAHNNKVRLKFINISLIFKGKK